MKHSYAAQPGILFLIILAIFTSCKQGQDLVERIPAFDPEQAMEEAVRIQIDEATRMAKRNPTAEKLGALGMAYHASAAYTEAETCYLLALEADSTAWTWPFYLGYLQLEMGKSEEAITAFERAVFSGAPVPQPWYYMGMAYQNMGRPSMASTCYNQIVIASGHSEDMFPLGIYTQFQIARNFQQEGLDSMAIPVLQQILNQTPAFGPAYRLLGSIYSMQGDSITGKALTVRANDLRPYVAPADSLLDQLALLSRSERYLLKEIDEAVTAVRSHWAQELVNQGMKNLEGHPDMQAKAMDIWLWTGEIERAAGLLPVYLETFANEYSKVYETGLSFMQLGRYAESSRLLTRAEHLKPGDMDTQKALAASLWHEGRHGEAQQLLQRVIQSHPEDFEVVAEIAELIFFELEERQGALQYLGVLEHVLPNDPRVLKMTAWMAANNGHEEEAIGRYLSSFQKEPGDLQTVRLLGDLFARLGLWEESIHLHVEALQEHPNDPYVLERLGTLLISCPVPELRQPGAGRIYAERAFLHLRAPASTSISAGRSLAMAHMEAGDKESAIRVMGITMDKARANPQEESFMALLESLASEISRMPA